MNRHEYKEIAEDLHRFTQQANFFLDQNEVGGSHWVLWC
jgi:hypothetical protein